VGLHLLLDANGDGVFSFPDERVTAGLAEYGTTLLYAPDGLAPGSYQLWVHGLVVRGAASVVDLHTTIMQGDNLRLENQPRGLADGAHWRMDVCAQDVDDLTGPMTGVIQFAYDSPPRLFRVMVDWRPAARPPSIYLPLELNGYSRP
jgi:hypothetical protein